MTNKEIAERLRELSHARSNDLELDALADELDPPRPEPGAVVCEYHIPFGILQDAILQFVGIENGEIQYNNLHVAVRITQDAAR